MARPASPREGSGCGVSVAPAVDGLAGVMQVGRPCRSHAARRTLRGLPWHFVPCSSRGARLPWRTQSLKTRTEVLAFSTVPPRELHACIVMPGPLRWYPLAGQRTSPVLACGRLAQPAEQHRGDGPAAAPAVGVMSAGSARPLRPDPPVTDRGPGCRTVRSAWNVRVRLFTDSPGGTQLTPRPLSEGFHADLIEHLPGRGETAGKCLVMGRIEQGTRRASLIDYGITSPVHRGHNRGLVPCPEPRGGGQRRSPWSPRCGLDQDMYCANQSSMGWGRRWNSR
jgi:hypothetical protein